MATNRDVEKRKKRTAHTHRTKCTIAPHVTHVLHAAHAFIGRANSMSWGENYHIVYRSFIHHIYVYSMCVLAMCEMHPEGHFWRRQVAYFLIVCLLPHSDVVHGSAQQHTVWFTCAFLPLQPPPPPVPHLDENAPSTETNIIAYIRIVDI